MQLFQFTHLPLALKDELSVDPITSQLYLLFQHGKETFETGTSIKVAANAVNSVRYGEEVLICITEACLEETSTGVRLTRAQGEPDDQALVMVGCSHDEQVKLFEAGQFYYQAGQYLLTELEPENSRVIEQDGHYAVVVLKPGDKILVKFDDGQTYSLRWNGVWMAHQLEDDVRTITPIEDLGRILSLENVSEDELQKGLKILEAADLDQLNDKEARMSFIDRAIALAKMFESRGDVSCASRSLKRAAVASYLVADEDDAEIDEQRQLINKEVERLAKVVQMPAASADSTDAKVD